MARQRRPGTVNGSPEHALRSGLGARRGKHLARIADAAPSADVSRWLKVGAVSEQLRPIVRTRLGQREQMVEDLGGAEHVSQMQRAALDTWMQAQVAADAEWRRYIAEDDRGALERLSTLLNTARAALVAVGLERRARDVTLDLSAYLDHRDAPAPRSATIELEADSQPALADDREAGASAAHEAHAEAPSEDDDFTNAPPGARERA